MKQTDINTLLGFAGITIATVSAVFNYIRTRNDNRRMRRKPLVFEIKAEPVEEQPDWSEVRITIRNFEPVAAKIVEIKIKAPALLLDEDTHEGVAWAPTLKNPLPLEMAARSIPMNCTVNAADNVSDGWNGNSSDGWKRSPVIYFSIYAYRWSGPKSLSIDWQWRDK